MGVGAGHGLVFTGHHGKSAAMAGIVVLVPGEAEAKWVGRSLGGSVVQLFLKVREHRALGYRQSAGIARQSQCAK